ncbi:MAG: heavy metal translocating P-type ATPase metal-binding domain-containing protein [Candidatus Kapabacteria bacterium]|nr:heavy metal translocating P-type ATPase metal-binding domain-containing protein [Candidatus Kapabacteria bacterium]
MLAEKIIENEIKTKCFHCGENLDNTIINFEEKLFCCDGCKTVFEILNQNDMCQFYDLNTSNGENSLKNKLNTNFAYLDDDDVISKLIQFTDGKRTSVIFHIPQIHCSSCIWLLENLFKLNSNVISSEVNFLKREAFISFNQTSFSLRQVVELLDKIGYRPNISLNDLEKPIKYDVLKNYYYKLGVAFFAFGNIMLLSFPEYFGLNSLKDSQFHSFFGYLNFLLSLPVLLFSASEFFRSAWNGLKQKNLNMDFPIVLGIVIMFLRSSYEIFSHTGSGYMDTLASLVFLMLIGRIFQNKTYEQLSFDRNFKSYLPIAITLKNKDGNEESVHISKLLKGDMMLIKSGELIPADSILMTKEAMVDYSFVTGESNPVSIMKGDKVFAGGKNAGALVEMQVIKVVSQSYLTKLWNDEAFKKDDNKNITTMANRFSKWFTLIIIFVAFASLVYWYNTDLAKGINAFTAVLIITCPCALALSTPFTLGNTLRIFGRNKFYLKNAVVVENLSKIDTIVFDKTGTITNVNDHNISFVGNKLSDLDKNIIFSLVRQSSHPLSRGIKEFLGKISPLIVSKYEEIVGKGISGVIEKCEVKISSFQFVNESDNNGKVNSLETVVYVQINNKVLGHFIFKNKYRDGLTCLIKNLFNKYNLHVLSGDNNSERDNLIDLFGKEDNIKFNLSPIDKLNYLDMLDQSGNKTLMIGDGLNDAGALKRSSVGIAISEDINNFSPACDAILHSKNFTYIDKFLNFSKYSLNVILISFAISLCYNIVGIYYSVQGNLSPLFAAIIMPISSVSIILITTLSTNIGAKIKGL